MIKRSLPFFNNSPTLIYANTSDRGGILNINSNDLEDILAHALDTIKEKMGENYSIEKVNLAELQRLTGISRSKLRRLKKNGFVVTPNGNKGKKSKKSVVLGYEDAIDDFLRKDVANSEVIFERLQEIGYQGSRTSIKRYIAAHKDLVPASREIVSPQGNRGRRYHTGPGENYQMDWGFVKVNTPDGSSYQCACFAMICHHCGERYVEFFPNARQENLFIGMIHAFIYMGIPKTVLTDNMKSVVIGRDAEGNPLWQKDYEAFMKVIGFHTKLCKCRHPFTKGKVERLVRFVKENFIIGRTFGNITNLNCDALAWCNQQNGKYHRAVDCIPSDVHARECLQVAETLTMTAEIMKYLCPVRKITFDGFVNYEGRRFGVPYTYINKTCRVMRKDFYLYIYDSDLTQQIAVHNVTWSRKDSYTPDQYLIAEPEELPTAPVRAVLTQKEEKVPAQGFEKFDFGKMVKWND